MGDKDKETRALNASDFGRKIDLSSITREQAAYAMNYFTKKTGVSSYAIASMLMGQNNSLPSGGSPEKFLTDDIFTSVGLYSRKDIREARFNRFSRFGRVLDPYGRVNAGREYLFFVKPDLHICIPDGKYPSSSIYSISGVESEPFSYNGLTLNPQLGNNQYFKDLIYTHPDVVRDLQYSVSKNGDPFSRLLSFSVNSSLPLSGSSAETIDNPATIFGTTYKYLQDSEASDEGCDFSLEFMDNVYLDTYHFFKAYSEYHIARKSGLITPPDMKYWQYKKLHNTMGIYKFIVGEDMETILYWAYIWGVYPTSCPREAFQDPSFSDGLTFSVNFESAFIEDMNPAILKQFNDLMRPVLEKNGCSTDRNPETGRGGYLPIVNVTNMAADRVVLDPKSADNLKSGFRINGMYANAGLSDSINGTLPVAALVDGRVLDGDERPKYRLRWYAPENN